MKDPHLERMALDQDQRIADVVKREGARLGNFIRRRVADPRDAEDILHPLGPNGAGRARPRQPPRRRSFGVRVAACRRRGQPCGRSCPPAPAGAERVLCTRVQKSDEGVLLKFHTNIIALGQSEELEVVPPLALET
jgi:hypothetical protein